MPQVIRKPWEKHEDMRALSALVNKLRRLKKKILLVFLIFRVLGPLRFVRFLHGMIPKKIYPMTLPPIEVKPRLDFLLLELPARFFPMLPLGSGYLHNALKETDIQFQILDTNVIMYHRYHQERTIKGRASINIPAEFNMSEDPWSTANASKWINDEVRNAFSPWIDETLNAIKANPPKFIGLTSHANNRSTVREFIKKLRAELPGIPILIGGYDCFHKDAGPFLVSDYDYMVIGEGERSVPALLKALLAGERPIDMPGVVSKWDSPGRVWESNILTDLDAIDFPRYEWTDLRLYQSFDGKRMANLCASRGCKWSRCRFCGECLTFRNRKPEKVVDEMEFFQKLGYAKLHFNESDINGDPQNLLDICNEAIRRDVKLISGGQIRISRTNTLEYFQTLAKAGIVRLIFGVDGWTDNILRIQRKGYAMKTVFENIKNCHEAGIFVAVNIVLGVPGETDQDIEETFQNIKKMKKYIDIIETVNTLILAGGSEFYLHPEQYNIKFAIPREEIYKKYPYVVPIDLWHSEEPYIDQAVRLKRLQRLQTLFVGEGFIVRPFAADVIKALQSRG